MKTWHFATMREPLCNLAIGERIVMIKSTVKHTDPTLGSTYWLMSVPNETIVHVAEPFFGDKLWKLVSIGQEVPTDKQGKCEARAKSLLVNSVYHPKNRKTHTYFFTSQDFKDKHHDRKLRQNLS